jgi:hypothetical protein
MAMCKSLSTFFLLCLAAMSGAAPFSYDPEEAKMFASLSSVTYCDNLDHVLDWTCTACKDSKTPLVPGKIRIVDAGKDNDTRIVIGKLRDQTGCLMAFRGSDNLENWVRDFQFWDIRPAAYQSCAGCKVHSGFYDIWQNVRDDAVAALRDVGCSPDSNNPDNLVYITGHSLGAALTHLAMFTLDSQGFKIAKSYSFEAPRVGNKVFSEEFSARFTSAFPLYRLTHSQDPVVHLPPEAFDYVHVQEEVFYSKAGEYKVCPKVEDPSCSGQYWDIPGMVLLHAGDHCSSPLVPNGDICNPIGCAKSSGGSSRIIV